MAELKKIRNLKLRNRVFLAPMLEPNDIAFRLLCKKAGAGLTYTGMVNCLSKQKLFLDDKPALQLFSNSDKGIKKFIKKYEEKSSLFDFNLGCPSKQAKKQNFGAYMAEDYRLIEKILKKIRNSTENPITIKIRKSSNALKIVKIAEKYCDAIGIHPRTKQQGYSGIPDYEFALKLKSLSSRPFIYSGDVNEKNYKKILEDFDFVMIGRKAIGNPCIFSKIAGKEYHFEFRDYLKLAKKYSLKYKQIKYQAINFTKNKRNAKKLRKELIKAKNIKDIKKIFSI
jgi:tRNA-dihydrouridine synthase B